MALERQVQNGALVDRAIGLPEADQQLNTNYIFIEGTRKNTKHFRRPKNTNPQGSFNADNNNKKFHFLSSQYGSMPRKLVLNKKQKAKQEMLKKVCFKIASSISRQTQERLISR